MKTVREKVYLSNKNYVKCKNLSLQGDTKILFWLSTRKWYGSQKEEGSNIYPRTCIRCEKKNMMEYNNFRLNLLSAFQLYELRAIIKQHTDTIVIQLISQSIFARIVDTFASAVYSFWTALIQHSFSYRQTAIYFWAMISKKLISYFR